MGNGLKSRFISHQTVTQSHHFITQNHHSDSGDRIPTLQFPKCFICQLSLSYVLLYLFISFTELA